MESGKIPQGKGRRKSGYFSLRKSMIPGILPFNQYHCNNSDFLICPISLCHCKIWLLNKFHIWKYWLTWSTFQGGVSYVESTPIVATWVWMPPPLAKSIAFHSHVAAYPISQYQTMSKQFNMTAKDVGLKAKSQLHDTTMSQYEYVALLAAKRRARFPKDDSKSLTSYQAS